MPSKLHEAAGLSLFQLQRNLTKTYKSSDGVWWVIDGNELIRFVKGGLIILVFMRRDGIQK